MKKKNQIDVDHLAKLANLPLSLKEKKELNQQLKKTISYIKILDKLKTDDLAPTAQVTGLENVFDRTESAKC